MNYHNIEKSAFHHGEYVGYGGGHVWRIAKSNSSYGTWWASPTTAPARAYTRLYAFRLADISTQLAALEFIN